MKNMQQSLVGIGIVALAFIITIGGVITAIAEKGSSGVSVASTDTPLPSPTTDQLASYTPLQLLTPTQTSAASIPPTATHTQIAAPASCPAPSGWSPVIINSGDTLASLAKEHNTTVSAIMSGNCLLVEMVQPNTILFLPNVVATNTPTPPPPPKPCVPPTGWITYTIKSGDTLYSIGRAFSISAAELQRANCMLHPDYIKAGEKLYVPNVPTITPTPTATSATAAAGTAAAGTATAAAGTAAAGTATAAAETAAAETATSAALTASASP